VAGPHHVTQRGNGRRFILDSDIDRRVYLDLLKQSLALHHIAIIGYCLMSNHVHLLLVPSQAESLGLALKHAHGRYASYWNALHQSCGHIWQGRYYSCRLDDVHLWTALRYTEMNPVRAGLVTECTSWKWSSAAIHCSAVNESTWLEMELWKSHWNPDGWRAFLLEQENEAQLSAIRTSTHTGGPLGTSQFVQTLERSTRRLLAPQKRGRRPKAIPNPSQGLLSLDA
jgi:putative transposase